MPTGTHFIPALLLLAACSGAEASQQEIADMAAKAAQPRELMLRKALAGAAAVRSPSCRASRRSSPANA